MLGFRKWYYNLSGFNKLGKFNTRVPLYLMKHAYLE